MTDVTGFTSVFGTIRGVANGWISLPLLIAESRWEQFPEVSSIVEFNRKLIR